MIVKYFQDDIEIYCIEGNYITPEEIETRREYLKLTRKSDNVDYQIIK